MRLAGFGFAARFFWLRCVAFSRLRRRFGTLIIHSHFPQLERVAEIILFQLFQTRAKKCGEARYFPIWIPDLLSNRHGNLPILDRLSEPHLLTFEPLNHRVGRSLILVPSILSLSVLSEARSICIMGQMHAKWEDAHLHAKIAALTVYPSVQLAGVLVEAMTAKNEDIA